MKKTTTKKPVKKAAKQTTAINHLQPIDDILDYIELHEIELINLLDSIPKKLEKLASSAKEKAEKKIADHKKATETLKSLQEKHKTKPNPMMKTAVKKAEQVLAEIAKSVESVKGGHAALEAQLATCKEMRKYLFDTRKPMVNKKRKKI